MSVDYDPEDYPVGAKVTFADRSDPVRGTGEPVVREGRVNGEPWMNEDQLVVVPVWAERDPHQEATTILVPPSHILKVDP